MATAVIAGIGLLQAAYADEAADMRGELESVKSRLSELESKADKSAGAASPSRGLSIPFTFNGYFRSGAGINDQGNDQSVFQAPGAGAKYRLGNEGETFGELVFGNKLQKSASDAYFRTEIMTSFWSRQDVVDDPANDQFSLREAYVEAGNLDFISPDVKIWAGKRYYMREDIHINDYFYLDMSGNGAGIMDVPVGDDFGKLAIAVLVGSRNQSLSNAGNPAKTTADLRLYDVDVPLGKLTIWSAFSKIWSSGSFTAGNDTYVYEESDGYNLGLIHRSGTCFGAKGFNKLALLYGRDAGTDFTSNLISPTAGATTYELNGRDATVLAESGMADINEHWSVMYAFVNKMTSGHDEGRDSLWTSAGIRPIYHFTRNFALGIEAGADYVDSEVLDTRGTLYKLTIAPEIRPDLGFFDRPVLRLFATFARWSEDFNNAGGVSAAYGNKTEGASFGAQVETWW
jgi:maltoporin